MRISRCDGNAVIDWLVETRRLLAAATVAAAVRRSLVAKIKAIDLVSNNSIMVILVFILPKKATGNKFTSSVTRLRKYHWQAAVRVFALMFDWNLPEYAVD